MKLKSTLSFLLTCFFSFQILAQCPSITITTTNVTCGGDNDGTLLIDASGGTPPYEYSIDGGVSYQANNFFEMLPGICDSAFVMDALGCTIGEPFCLTEPIVLTVSVTLNNHISCLGLSDGSATVNVQGGSPPYSIQWGNGENAWTATALNVGAHTVVITDMTNCTAFSSVIILEPEYLDVTLTATAETCQGLDGTITSTVTGGTPPYDYVWSNGATSSDITGLTAGDYSLTVYDFNGCLSVTNIELLSVINIGFTVTPATCDQADGSVTSNVTGVTNPIYSWNNGASTTAISGLAQGWYSLTVEEAGSGCQTHRNVFVDEELSCKVTIDGYVFNDGVNGDCLEDPSTIPVAYKYITLKSAGVLVASTFTNPMGYYELVVDKDVYDLELGLNNIDSLLCPASSSISVNANTNGQTYSNNFYLDRKKVQDLAIYLNLGTARPGFFHYEYITYCNEGSFPMDGSFSLKHDSILIDFTAPGTTNYDPQTYTATWDFAGLGPGQCQTANVQFLVPATTPLNTLLTEEVTINPIAGDFTPGNNTTTAHAIVTGSFDPNDKQNMSSRDPFGGDIDPGIETYNYKIRFQNTGTDTAFTVVVKDEIEANLDISSVRTVAASHDYSMDVENGNTLVFFFDNIMLPDSNVNEPASHGFIYFTIDKMQSLPLGTEIKNDAAIYFDFNAPIITNEVVNVLAVPDGIKPNVGLPFAATIAPNPSSGSAVISLDLEKAAELDISILDLQGRVVATLLDRQLLSQGAHSIPLNLPLGAGVYFLQVKSDEGVSSRKFVLLK